jgi:hypothetical protein
LFFPFPAAEKQATKNEDESPGEEKKIQVIAARRPIKRRRRSINTMYI